MIRVLLGHRGTLLRGALAVVLSREDDLEVVAEVARGDEVADTARRKRPQVAVLGPMLPGPVDVHQLCLTLPSLRVLLLMDRKSRAGSTLSLARLAPRVGLIATDTSVGDLVEAVRQMAGGKPVLDTELAVAALTAVQNPLTDRECDVLRLLMTGATAHEIAQNLHLSAGTVRNYLSQILAKTGARTRIEAIKIAQDAGWI